MNGAEILLRTAAEAGVKVCFANAGTTEIPMVLAFDSEPRIKPVLGLFEGVCTGAADGYGRLSDRPAMTMLHLGPGFANGVANLHNARKARTPVVNVVGEHASWHHDAGAPLAMDIEKLVSTVSGWYRTSSSPSSISQDMAEAIAASLHGQIATLIVPSDYQWTNSGVTEISAPKLPAKSFDSSSIARAVKLLKGHRKTALLLGGKGLGEKGLNTAAQIQAATGCDLLANTFPSYVERGVGLPHVMRVPYFPDAAMAMLSPYEAVVLVGAREPVTFFGYEGFSSRSLRAEIPKVTIASENEDSLGALVALAEALGAPKTTNTKVSRAISRPEVPRGGLTAENACRVIAALQPEGAVVVDEGITTSFTYYSLGMSLPRHTVMTVVGGSIGYGMPCSLGVALAHPDRPVINIQADGSAMYTVQALWTQAREKLNVSTLICSNRSYQILRTELTRANITGGPNVAALIDLDNPAINWVSIAQAMGVPAKSVDTAEALTRELGSALNERGPHLIEMKIKTGVG